MWNLAFIQAMLSHVASILAIKAFVSLKLGHIASTFGYSGRRIFKAKCLMFCPMNAASLLRRITWFVSRIDQIGVTSVVLNFVASLLATREVIKDIVNHMDIVNFWSPMTCHMWLYGPEWHIFIFTVNPFDRVSYLVQSPPNRAG